MAGTAKRFNRILQKEINVHAAWLPVANTSALGDYGLISDGVFTKMGNISEFGIDAHGASGNPIGLDFSSEGTRVFKLIGDTEVDTLPDSDIEAKVRIEFSKQDSFLLKAQLNTFEMQSVAMVARSLSQAPGWRKKYRVVSAVYTGEDCMILSTREANSKVELSGKADALKKFDLGKVEAGLNYDSTKQLGLEIVGDSGVVGLGLFRLGFGGNVRVLSLDGAKVEIEETDDWDADLEDDV